MLATVTVTEGADVTVAAWQTVGFINGCAVSLGITCGDHVTSPQENTAYVLDVFDIVVVESKCPPNDSETPVPFRESPVNPHVIDEHQLYSA